MVNQSKDIIQVQGINSQGYGIIPKMVMQDKRLTIQAKAIYGYFCSYAVAGKTAFPKQAKILTDLKISRNCYYTHFNLLKEYGYIQTYQEKNEDGFFARNIYTLVETLPCTKIEDTDTVSPCTISRDTVQRDTIRWDTNNNSTKINSIYNYQSGSQDETDGRPLQAILNLIKEIRSHKGTPYQMANEEYADEMFPYVKQIYPVAQMVKYDIEQYIVVTKRARAALIKRLGASRSRHENYITEIDRAVNELKQGGF